MTRPPHSMEDLDHDALAVLAREYLLAGHLIDRAGMPVIIQHGRDVMRDVAIDEWMAASPIYSKRMQQLLGFAGDTVEACLKGMQIDIGAPPEFMDFRMEVADDHHGGFHLDHCGALMDVEPMGEDFVVAMCHHIEDPTFDATGWATNPKLRMRPVHRPPRIPADRHPHCAWTVTIDESGEPTEPPQQAERLRQSHAARLPLAHITEPADPLDGDLDYRRPLDPNLDLRAFATPALRAILEEVSLQAHLLVMGFTTAVEARLGADVATDAVAKQFAGVAGVVAERLCRTFELDRTAAGVATVFDLHPAFRPRGYIDWEVTVDGDGVSLRLGDSAATSEPGFSSWITTLAAGHDRPLRAIAAGVDPHWSVRPEGRGSWRVERTEAPADELPEVTLTKFSTGAAFRFDR